MSRAAVLLSGGLDSATVLAQARANRTECHCLSVAYGQRHEVELQAAKRLATALGAASHREVALDLRAIGGSALTAEIEVPKGDDPDTGGVPITYVPARNTVLLALLLGLAEVEGCERLLIGANAIDYSGYPDCRPAFLEAFAKLARVATKAGAEGGVTFTVEAPLLELDKAAIVRLGAEHGLDHGMTWSCYDPRIEDDRAWTCGACDSCQLRARGFAGAGIVDPLVETGFRLDPPG